MPEEPWDLDPDFDPSIETAAWFTTLQHARFNQNYPRINRVEYRKDLAHFSPAELTWLVFTNTVGYVVGWAAVFVSAVIFMRFIQTVAGQILRRFFGAL
jgi:hypothetical protein